MGRDVLAESAGEDKDVTRGNVWCKGVEECMHVHAPPPCRVAAPASGNSALCGDAAQLYGMTRSYPVPQ